MKHSDIMAALEMFHIPYGLDTEDKNLCKSTKEDPTLGPFGEEIGWEVNHYKDLIEGYIHHYEDELEEFLNEHGYETRMGLICKVKNES